MLLSPENNKKSPIYIAKIKSIPYIAQYELQLTLFSFRKAINSDPAMASPITT